MDQPKKVFLSDLIEFNQDSGAVSIKEDRVVLFQVNALNQLKDELIKTLGVELARGILMRSGYRCGFNDAKTITSTYGIETKWLSLGPIMYSWKGLGQVQVETVLECDTDIKSYFLKGKWINSQEAQLYLNTSGKAAHPVCWISTGYASGFATGFLGYDVFCEENTCVGKGDAHCGWEMRSKEDWGEKGDFFVDLFNPKFEFKDLQTLLLEERSNQIHRRLTELVLEGKGIQPIADTLTEIINCPVLVFNQYQNIVGNSFLNQQNFTDIEINRLKYIKEHHIKKLWNNFVADPKIVKLGPLEEIGLENTLLLSPIIAGAKMKGLLVVEQKTEIPYTDLRAIEHACTVFALEFIKEEAALEAEIRIKGDFLGDLLNFNPKNLAELKSKGMKLGYNFQEKHLVMIADIRRRNKQKQHLIQESDILIDIKGYVKFLVDKYAPKSLITLNQDQVVLVLNLEQLSIEEIDLAEKILKTITSNYPGYSIKISLGRKCLEYTDFKKSYDDALLCLEVMKKNGEHNSIRTFDELGIYGILWDMQSPERLKDFAYSQLGNLIDYDKNKGTNLLDTLELYFSNDCSIKKTADSAFIHVSSLKYRLKRIEILTDKDLSREEARFDLQLSLRILRTLKQ
jgi:PucR family transcriptional regulator, purine catabolism regulatory protein